MGNDNCNPISKDDCLAEIEIFEIYNESENKYLEVLRSIIDTGIYTQDRTGVGTISSFGQMLKFPLENGCIPALTTKRLFFKGVLMELLWFIKGNTYAKDLQDQGVHIWDGNGSREFWIKEV